VGEFEQAEHDRQGGAADNREGEPAGARGRRARFPPDDEHEDHGFQRQQDRRDRKLASSFAVSRPGKDQVRQPRLGRAREGGDVLAPDAHERQRRQAGDGGGDEEHRHERQRCLGDDAPRPAPAGARAQHVGRLEHEHERGQPDPGGGARALQQERQCRAQAAERPQGPPPRERRDGAGGPRQHRQRADHVPHRRAPELRTDGPPCVMDAWRRSRNRGE
jgi:hypothetical protein